MKINGSSPAQPAARDAKSSREPELTNTLDGPRVLLGNSLLGPITAPAPVPSRGPKFEQGRRYGVKACVTFLHAQAEQMNDPRARAILNVAAREMGLHFKAPDPNAGQTLPASRLHQRASSEKTNG